jgi:hypothetical protein
MQAQLARRRLASGGLTWAVAVHRRALPEPRAREPRRVRRAERAQAERVVPAVKAACRLAHPIRLRRETAVRAWATLALGETIRPCRAGLTLSAMALDIGSSRLLSRSAQFFLPPARRCRTQRVRIKRPASMVRGRTQELSALAPRQVSWSLALHSRSFLAQAARRSCRTRALLARFQTEQCAGRFPAPSPTGASPSPVPMACGFRFATFTAS